MEGERRRTNKGDATEIEGERARERTGGGVTREAI